MPDLEKAIKGLECCSAGKEKPSWLEKTARNCEKCPYNLPGVACTRAMAYDALFLLKAQEPVKPFVTGNGHTFEEAETWWYECGNCNEPIDPNDQYCRHCGRAVKWNG